MPEHEGLIRTFLQGTQWAEASRAPLAGDASNRRYERLTKPASGQTAILMDAPPQRGEDVRPFLRIARHLRKVGLSAPGILAEDTQHGLLLIEDLGDGLFARLIPQQPQLEQTLYAAATDVLLTLHRAPMPELESYDTGLMTDLAALAYAKYRFGLTGNTDGEAAFRNAFARALDSVTPDHPVLIQRDYHAENLLWLPERSGVARVGLLDFQDAMAGHPAYDLVSLLQDARRDVPQEIETAMIARYLAGSDLSAEEFNAAYAILGAQRNLRILGVFARLSLEHGKPRYVDLIPRVWGHLMRDLDHPALGQVADLLRDTLPAPTPDRLLRLKAA
ncbi:phosphotransferase [Rhodobacteraceae bacterium F11138]|nr:phosphotransferase [Rhodobacteraceae bacterium F11138]